MSDLGGHISPAVRGHSSLPDFRRTRGRRLLFVDRRRSLHVDSKPRRRGDFMSTIGKKAAKDTMILCVMGIRAQNDSPIFWGPQSTGSTTPNNGSPLRPRYACCGAPPPAATPGIHCTTAPFGVSDETQIWVSERFKEWANRLLPLPVVLSRAVFALTSCWM